MPTITFSSPKMDKDVTVYAVAGETDKSVLKLAKANDVPLPFKCEDGKCGSCVCRVDSLEEGKTRMGETLTETERETLLSIGMITEEEIKEAEVKDMPPSHRLACQLIPRNEDLLVQFSGEPGVDIES